jgi:hypothetical protein
MIDPISRLQMRTADVERKLRERLGFQESASVLVRCDPPDGDIAALVDLFPPRTSPASAAPTSANTVSITYDGAAIPFVAARINAPGYEFA